MVRKELQKLSQWFGKGFRNGMMEGEKMESYKKGFWSWTIFLLSKYWLPLLFEEILGDFLSFSILFFLFLSLSLFSILFLPLSLSLSFYALSLEDLEVLMILEEKNHFFKNFILNEMVWTG
jgi:hypothetical protein